MAEQFRRVRAAFPPDPAVKMTSFAIREQSPAGAVHPSGPAGHPLPVYAATMLCRAAHYIQWSVYHNHECQAGQ